MPEVVVAKRSRAEKNAARRKRKRDAAAAAAAAAAAPATHDPAAVPAPQVASGSSTADRASRREVKHGVTTKKQRLAISLDATGSPAPTAAAGAARGELVPDGHRMQHAHLTGLQRSSGAADARGGERQGHSSADGREGGSRAAATGACRGEGVVAAPGAAASPSACKSESNGKNISSGDKAQKRKKKKNKRGKKKAEGPQESLPPPSATLPTPRTPREPTGVVSSPSECRSRQVSTTVARGGDGNGSGGTRKDEEARSLSKALESVRKKHRQEIGSGKPLVGWDVAAYAGFVFGELAAAVCGGQGEEEEENGGAVAGAVDAVSAAAEKEHAGQ
ncbi:unnamed protein product, partial [Ectocarpus sp. 12 AP-2014]